LLKGRELEVREIGNRHRGIKYSDKPEMLIAIDISKPWLFIELRKNKTIKELSN